MAYHKSEIQFNGQTITVETGKIAMQSHGAIMLTMGGTALFAAVTVDKKDTEQDFFPLSVEYIEKMYARGAISGSRFQKREGHPSDEAVIKAREVDHSIRSLFPKSFKRPVSVVLTVMAYDGINDPQALSILGTSLALMQSGLPFAGPCASVIVCVDKDGKAVINPSAEDREKFEAEFIISATGEKILSLEGWGKEVSDETMDNVLDKAIEVIAEINKQQVTFINTVGQTLKINAADYDNTPAPHDLIEIVKKEKLDEISKALFTDKADRNEDISKIKDDLSEKLSAGEKESYSGMEVDLAVEYVARKIIRDSVLKEEKRASGRKLDEIRPLSAEVDLLPTVHGSALFTRGVTQSLSIVTLASKRHEQIIDDMEGETIKRFMHHYNFPPFSTGEAGRYRYFPGRREVGHGAIGENALRFMIPDDNTFPYTIRAVSEIMSSNGSTSMAATCASSMALMAAGVPIKEQVAGIGVGLVTEDENEDNYKLLLDIEGMEDFYGDMDFKVCGTKNGITAIQYENKLQGVKVSVLKEAFRLAHKGRLQVLEVMNKAIATPRAELAENAPKVQTISIPQENIGELIGPGGRNIKDLVAQSEQYGRTPGDIEIQDDGTVVITAANKEQMTFILEFIKAKFKKPEVGEIFEGVVDKIMPYGIFVDVSSNISGLCHVSEMDKEVASNLQKSFKEGQKVKVRVSKVENGRISFSLKGV